MPRAGVTSEKVIRNAEELTDHLGLENVTLAAVAESLGIRLPSLYKHIEGLPALRSSVRQRAILELTEVMTRATVGRAGAHAVVALATAMRGWARNHPGRYAATVAPSRRQDRPAPDVEEPAAEAALNVVFDVLSAFDLSGEDAIHATRILRSLLHGFVSLEAAGGFAMSADVDRSFERAIDVFVASLPTFGKIRTTVGESSFTLAVEE